jgi:O-antigen/teichoic acid export membrane protein
MVSGLITTFARTVVLALGYPICLHFLDYEQYGVWLVLTTVLTFAQLGNLGIDAAVVKLVAEERGRGDHLGVQRYITTALVLVCISGSAVLVVILALRRPIITLFALSGENARTALWLLPYVGLLTLYVLMVQVFEAALSGLGRMDLASYRGLLARFISLCISTGLLCWGVGLQSLLIGRMLAELITHLAAFLCLRHMTHIRIRHLFCFDVPRCKRLLGFGGTMLGGSLLNMLISPLNKLILSRYVGVGSIPIYEMAFTGSLQIRGLVSAGHAALIPEISRVSAARTPQAHLRVLRLYRRSWELILLLGAPAYAALALLAPTLLKVWLGNRFIEPLPGTFRILLAGSFVSVLGSSAYVTLVGTGQVQHNLMASVVQAVTNVAIILGCLAVFTVTVSAVAWSSSIAMAAAACFMVLQKRRVLSDMAGSWSQ